MLRAAAWMLTLVVNTAHAEPVIVPASVDVVVGAERSSDATPVLAVSGAENASRMSYLRFRSASVDPTAERVVLRMYVAASSGAAAKVVLAPVEPGTWTQRSPTWTERPGTGEHLAELVPDGDGVVEFDLTQWVRARQTAGAERLELALLSPDAATWVELFSRDAMPVLGPQLVVTPRASTMQASR